MIRRNEAQVELYIDRGKDREDENMSIFKQIENEKSSIEESFGESLEWESLEGRRACRIKNLIKEGGYQYDETKWPEIQTLMVDAMLRLEKALKPNISTLNI